jgi:hypothetical protein
MKKKPINSLSEIPDGMTDQESRDFWERHEIGSEMTGQRGMAAVLLANDHVTEKKTRKPTKRTRGA